MAFKKRQIASTLACLFGVGSAFLVATAQAADVSVQVTGTNIRRVDAETASPVQVLTAEELAESGYTTVSEVLRDITANGQGLLSQGFNGAFAGGASGVALRGLSVGATLVLIDGLRMVGYPLADDAQRNFVDISSIPFSAVERIEVLLDGASAIYGSDAIGGVVNVILKKGFTGTQLLAEGGATFQGDGANVHVSLLTGMSDESGKYSGFLSVEYRKQNEIKYQDRSDKDWANMDWSGAGGIDLRPGARSPAQANPILLTPYLQRPGSSASDPTAFAFLDSNCNFAARNANQCLYENTWDTIQPETQNVNVIGRFNAKLDSDWLFSLTGSYFDSRSEQNRRPFAVPAGSAAPNIAYGPGQPPALVNGISAFTVPASYPGNTLGVPAIVRALVPDISNQNIEFSTGTTRIVADLSGSFAEWDLRFSAGYTQATTKKTNNGFVNYNALLAALNDPVRPLSLLGGNPSEVVSTYAPTVESKYKNELDFFQVDATRDLMKLEGGPLGVALGASYVYQKLDADNPAPCKDGSVAGLNCAYAIGSQSDTAFYAEVLAPVLKSLELSAAVRYDYYDTYGGQWTPKFGAKWTPIKELAIRGTWGQGFRAPYITENGDAGSAFSAQGIRDPLNCPDSNANGSPNLTSPNNVVSTPTGVNPCNFNSTYLQSTTPDLEPEKSNNWTLGFVAEPVRDFSLAADYYSIAVKNQIISVQSTSTFDPLAVAVRGPINSVTFGDGRQGPSPAGLINYIPVGYVNAQKTTVTGLDLQTVYALRLPDESRLKLGAQWSHIFSWDLEFEGQTYKLAGTHGPANVSGNTGNPRDRVQLSGQWAKGPFTGTLIGNYVSGYSMTDPSSGFNTCDGMASYGNPFRWPSGGVPDQYCRVDSFWYWNLNLSYDINKELQVRLAVTNLFNQQAPIDVGGYAGTGDNRNSSRGAPYNPSLHWAGVAGAAWLLGITYNFDWPK